ncbi:hypothetical protein ACLKA6_001015 [Drosophila palustris]
MPSDGRLSGHQQQQQQQQHKSQLQGKIYMKVEEDMRPSGQDQRRVVVIIICIYCFCAFVCENCKSSLINNVASRKYATFLFVASFNQEEEQRAVYRISSTTSVTT